MELKKRLTQTRLKKLLNFDPTIGIFTWKVSRGGRRPGEIAGSLGTDGYWYIMIDYKKYHAARLSWLYVYGYVPENFLSRSNCKKNLNWISNVRGVPQIYNFWKKKAVKKKKKTDIKGIYLDRKYKKWRVTIKRESKTAYLGTYYLGAYNDFTEAVCARLAGEQCLNWSGCDNSSPAYKYVKEKIQRRYNHF